MRTIQLHGPGDLRITDIPEPGVDEGLVRLDVAYTGICGSDLHEYKIGPVPIRAEEKDHVIPESEWDDHLPKGMGHEISGTVAEVGPGVDSVSVGDRVTTDLILSCGECRYCLAGKPNLCDGGSNAVAESLGFADNLVAPATALVPVPDGVSLQHAALTEPLAVSLRGVRRSGLAVGDRVAVFGAGPIGLGVIAAAHASGAREIWVSEPREARREAARELGATQVLDPSQTDVRDEIRTASTALDVAFETSGVESAFTDALRVTKNDGAVVVLSVFEETAAFHPNDIMQAERTVIGSFAYDGAESASNSEYGMVLDLLNDGRIDPEPFITDVVSLDATENAFESLLAPDSEQIKVLVEP